MKITLIYPPATDPRAPKLALACLAAYLRSNGVEVTLLDLDIEGLHALLNPDRLKRAREQLKNTGQNEYSTNEDRTSILKIAEQIEDKSNHAISILQNSRHFFHANDFNTARDIISSALRLHSLASELKVDYSIVPIRYDVQGCNPQRIADLVDITSDPRANLFHDFWRDEVIPSIEENSPDLIGISICNRQQIIPGLILAKQLRNHGHFVVIGGTLYSKFPETLSQLPEFFQHFADGIIIYEGETALLHLINELEHDRDFSRIPNFMYFDGTQVRKTVVHVEDINSLPTPDFSGLPINQYLAPFPVLPIYVGKGCYFNKCKFCGIPTMNDAVKKKYRIRKPELVVNDVRMLAQRHCAHHFVITDESLPPKLLLQLADAFDAHPDEHYNFTCYARLEKGLTHTVCSRIRDMGIKKILFGLESGSQQTLDHMKKGTKIKYAPQVLKNCRLNNINFHIFSIIGLPEEQESSAWKTFNFFIENRDIIDHPGNSFDIHPFGLVVQSSYFYERNIFGLEVDKDALNNDFKITIDGNYWQNTRGLNRQQVKHLIEREFYPRLKRVFHKYHNTPLHLWPGSEEYSVLYCCYYQNRHFPFATSIPQVKDKRLYRLRWNPALNISFEIESVALVSHDTLMHIPKSLYELVDNLGCTTTANLLTLAQESSSPGLDKQDWKSNFKECLEMLFGEGFLQLEEIENEETQSFYPFPAGTK